METTRRPAPESRPEPVRMAAVAPTPPDSSSAIEPPADIASGDATSEAERPRTAAPLQPARQLRGDVPLPPARPFDLGSNRGGALVVAAAAPAPARSRAILPPRRPELHASAGKALYFADERSPRARSGARRALDNVKPVKAKDE